MQKTDEISEVFTRRNGNSPVKNYSRWTISKSHVDKNILIITETDITTKMAVCKVLERVDSFELRDDCFVDYIVSRRDDSRHEVMLPGKWLIL